MGWNLTDAINHALWRATGPIEVAAICEHIRGKPFYTDELNEELVARTLEENAEEWCWAKEGDGWFTTKRPLPGA
ncbi:MAG: hypothetical protein ACYTDY_06400 [Planctomycetota bacterium]|jgi:hypothetical protein